LAGDGIDWAEQAHYIFKGFLRLLFYILGLNESSDSLRPSSTAEEELRWIRKKRRGEYGLSRSNEAQSHEGWFGRSDGISDISSILVKSVKLSKSITKLFHYGDFWR